MIFTILGLCLYILGIFFEIYFDRDIVYLAQLTLRHIGQNRAFELELVKNQEFQYHFRFINLSCNDGITNTTPKKRKILSEEESKKVN